MVAGIGVFDSELFILASAVAWQAQCLCVRVPSATPHLRHLGSSTSLALDLRAWGHCAPTTVDRKCPAAWGSRLRR